MFMGGTFTYIVRSNCSGDSQAVLGAIAGLVDAVFEALLRHPKTMKISTARHNLEQQVIEVVVPRRWIRNFSTFRIRNPLCSPCTTIGSKMLLKSVRSLAHKNVLPRLTTTNEYAACVLLAD